MRISPGHLTDVVVVGAGVIGLACALAAARRGKQVVVFDRHTAGSGISSNTSRFLHAGRAFVDPKRFLYIPQMARERQRMLAWCPELITARTAFAPHSCFNGGRLAAVARTRAYDSLRLEGPEWASECDATAPEAWRPLLKACHHRGVLTKELTVDVAGLVQRLQAEIMPYGGQVFEGTEVCAAKATNNGWNLQLSRNGEKFSMYSRGVMNCAGPDSARVLTNIFGQTVRFSPRTARATHITVKSPQAVSSVLFLRSSKRLGLFTMPLSDSVWRLGATNDHQVTASEPKALQTAAMHDAEIILSELSAYFACSPRSWDLLDTTTSLRMYAPPAEPEHFARSPQHVLRLDAGECPPVVSVLYARMEWLHTISESATEALLNALGKT